MKIRLRLKIDNMEAKEFRIGNYVYQGDIKNQIGEIRIISKDNIDFWELYLPITLTEEWLIKFGFYKSNDMWINKVNPWFKLCENSGYYKLVTSSELIGKQFKTVHQLQNLYFALTGEELEICE